MSLANVTGPRRAGRRKKRRKYFTAKKKRKAQQYSIENESMVDNVGNRLFQFQDGPRPVIRKQERDTAEQDFYCFGVNPKGGSPGATPAPHHHQHGAVATPRAVDLENSPPESISMSIKAVDWNAGAEGSDRALSGPSVEDGGGSGGSGGSGGGSAAESVAPSKKKKRRMQRSLNRFLVQHQMHELKPRGGRHDNAWDDGHGHGQAPFASRMGADRAAADGTTTGTLLLHDYRKKKRSAKWFPDCGGRSSEMIRQRNSTMQRGLMRTNRVVAGKGRPSLKAALKRAMGGGDQDHMAMPFAAPYDRAAVRDRTDLIASKRDNFTENLTTAQLQAVAAPIFKPLCIAAGPGAGKTRTLISRLCYLTDKCGVDPRLCLVFTFTKAATEEIRERYGEIMADSGTLPGAPKPAIRNFHSFALQIILRHCSGYDILGRGQNVSVLTQQEQYNYVSVAISRIRERERIHTGNRALNIPTPVVAKDCATVVHGGAKDDFDLKVGGGVEDFVAEKLKLWDKGKWGHGHQQRSIHGSSSFTTAAKAKPIGFQNYPLTGKAAPDPDCVTHFMKFIQQSKARMRYPWNFDQGGEAGEAAAAAAQGGDGAGCKLPNYHLDIYAAYEELLDLNNKIDYGDFIPGLLYLFDQSPALLEEYRKIYRFVFVDEFQDLNLPQICLLQRLCPSMEAMALAGIDCSDIGEDARFHPPCITVCGDANQSIYGFRGACGPTAFRYFKTYWASHRAVELVQNHRSTKAIVVSARNLIKHNGGRKGSTNAPGDQPPPMAYREQNGEGLPVKVFTTCSPRAECERIANYVKLKHQNHGVAYNKFAVLARSLYIVREIEAALIKKGIPVDGVFNNKNAKEFQGTRGSILETPTGYFFYRLGHVVLRDESEDEFLDVMAPDATVCPFKISKATVAVVQEIASRLGNCTYMEAARWMVTESGWKEGEWEEQGDGPAGILGLPTKAGGALARPTAKGGFQTAKSAHEENAREESVLQMHMKRRGRGQGQGPAAQQGEKNDDIATVLSNRIDNSQMKALDGFVQFVDHLRPDCDTLAPNEVLQEMVFRCKFFAHLKNQRETVPDMKPYYEIISAMENDASLFATRWIRAPREDQATEPGDGDRRRRGKGAMLEWLTTLKDPGTPPSPEKAAPEKVALNAVTVTSVHRAKGCEWPVVIVARMNEGTFPIDARPRRHHATVVTMLEGGDASGHRLQRHAGANERLWQEEDAETIEEERRLAYVALTRASKELVLTSVTHNGEDFVEMSRFVEEAMAETPKKSASK
jgi:superfamily I DNA/RNA helicase